MEQLKFDTTGYRKYVDMSYRYANGAKNKGNNFQYDTLVDKTAMDAWLEEQNKRMTEDMRNKFGDLIASAGYYFDMQDGPKPGYIDVVVNTPDDTPDERLKTSEIDRINDYLNEHQASFAKQFNKQPFTMTDAGFAKLPSVNRFGLERNDCAILHVRDAGMMPQGYDTRELLGGKDDSFVKISVTRSSENHFNRTTYDYRYMFQLPPNPASGDLHPINQETVYEGVSNCGYFIGAKDITVTHDVDGIYVGINTTFPIDTAEIMDVLDSMNPHHFYNIPFTLDTPYDGDLMEWNAYGNHSVEFLDDLQAHMDARLEDMDEDEEPNMRPENIVFADSVLIDSTSGYFQIGSVQELNDDGLRIASELFVRLSSYEDVDENFQGQFSKVSVLTDNDLKQFGVLQNSVTAENPAADDGLGAALDALKQETQGLEQ